MRRAIASAPIHVRLLCRLTSKDDHFAFSVPSAADVGADARYLADRNVPRLFETPRHRPEFAHAGENYYRVMFESPDRFLFEVVYTGPK